MLIRPVMKSAFRALFDSNPRSRAEVAQKWAAAYDSYASAASTSNGGTIIPAGRKSALEGVLMGALSTPIGVPAVVAAGWAAGMLAYWGGTPFTPGAVPNPPFTLPGVATPPVGTGALVAALTAIYLRTDSADGFAEAHSVALDACTKTVVVLFGAVPQPVM
jgi:hypothetical protein